MKPTNHLPRRDFLQLMGTGAVGLYTATLFGSCEDVFQEIIDAIANRPVRRFIRNGDAVLDQDIQIYRDAVSAMQALPNTDPRNWNNQANIHLNHCPHGGWFFLPWHRAYLYYFERICRELTGESDWGLPYWNWSTHPSIPAQFWGGGNSLYHANRLANSASTASTSAVGPPVISSILAETNFLLFAGNAASSAPLEYTPHNHIHNFIGGTMGTFNSPRDPVFWTHHNMVDCIWAKWNMDLGNDNTNDPAWLNHNFTGMFFDEDGNPVDIEVSTTLLFPFLTYQFEPSQKGEPEEATDLLAKSKDELKRMKKRLETGIEVKLDYRKKMEISRGERVVLGQVNTYSIDLEQGDLDKIIGGGRKERALLTVGDINLPKTGDFFVRVFVNHPDANPDTPTDIPNYAGSFYFFVDPEHQHHGHHKETNFIVDLSETLRRLNQSAGLTGVQGLSLQLVPVLIPGRELEATVANFEVRQLELGFSPVQLTKKNDKQ